MTDQIEVPNPESPPLAATEIVRLRKMLGYSQTSFANALNTSQTMVSRWERGVSPLTPGEEAKMLSLPKVERKRRTNRKRPCAKCGYQPPPATPKAE